MVIQDDITIGQLVTFTTYLGMMVWPLLALGLFFNIVQRGHASYERINEITNVQNDVDTEVKTDMIPEGIFTLTLNPLNFQTMIMWHYMTFISRLKKVLH